MNDFGRCVFTGQIKDLEWQLENAKNRQISGKRKIRELKRELKEARSNLKAIMQEGSDPDRFPPKFYETMARAAHLHRLQEKLEANMHLNYYLSIIKDIVIKDFPKSFAIVGAFFGITFIWYLVVSLIFSNLWVTLFLFSVTVAWGTWFSYGDRQPHQNPVVYRSPSASAEEVGLEVEEPVTVEAEEERILGA